MSPVRSRPPGLPSLAPEEPGWAYPETSALGSAAPWPYLQVHLAGERGLQGIPALGFQISIVLAITLPLRQRRAAYGKATNGAPGGSGAPFCFASPEGGAAEPFNQ